MGSKKSKTSSQSVQSNDWSEPDERNLRNLLVQDASNGLGKANGMDDADTFFRSLLNPDQTNPYFDKYAAGVRDLSSLKTNSDLAKQRSQYRLRPAAASNFAMDETVANNNTQRDNLLYQALMNQFNTSRAQGLDAGKIISANSNMRSANALSILDLLKDAKTQSNSTTKESGGTAAKIAGAIASAVAAYATGGVSLAATAAASKGVADSMK